MRLLQCKAAVTLLDATCTAFLGLLSASADALAHLLQGRPCGAHNPPQDTSQDKAKQKRKRIDAKVEKVHVGQVLLR